MVARRLRNNSRQVAQEWSTTTRVTSPMTRSGYLSVSCETSSAAPPPAVSHYLLSQSGA
jgi:hypothetical protein